MSYTKKELIEKLATGVEIIQGDTSDLVDTLGQAVGVLDLVSNTMGEIKGDSTKVEGNFKEILSHLTSIASTSEEIEKHNKATSNSSATQVQELGNIKQVLNDIRRALEVGLDVQVDSNEATRRGVEFNREMYYVVSSRVRLTARERDLLERRNILLSRGTTIGRSFLNIATDGFRRYLEADSKAREVNRHLGMSTSQIGQYQRGIHQLASSTLLSIGVNAQDLMSIQSNFIAETGRNILIARDALENTARIGRVLGDPVAGAKWAASMDRFGISAQQSSEFVTKIFNSAAEGGVSMTRAAETVQENLGLVNRFGFRDGVTGLRRMAVYSLQTRTNMQNVANAARSVNTLQGAIEASARLNVLGGTFARHSNPLQMFFEATNDFEAFGERINNMFTENMVLRADGTFGIDNAIARMRMHRATEAMQLDFDDTYAAAQTKAMRNEISRRIHDNRIGGRYMDDATVGMIASRARLTEGDGVKITMVVTEANQEMLRRDGKLPEIGRTIDVTTDDITGELLDYMRHQDRPIEHIAGSVTAVQDILQGFKFLVGNFIARFMASGFGRLFGGVGNLGAGFRIDDEGNIEMRGERRRQEDGTYKYEYNAMEQGWGSPLALGVMATSVIGGMMLGKRTRGYWGGRRKMLEGGGGVAEESVLGNRKKGRVVARRGGVEGVVDGGRGPVGVDNTMRGRWARAGRLVRGAGIAGTAVGVGMDGLAMMTSERGTQERANATGRTIGGVAGAAIGAAFGPIGMMVGQQIGAAAGGAIGNIVHRRRERRDDRRAGITGTVSAIRESNSELDVLKFIGEKTFSIERILMSRFNTNEFGVNNRERERLAAGGIVSINDGRFNPGSSKTIIDRGKMYKTHPDDTVIASKPHGPLWNNVSSKPLSLNTPQIKTPAPNQYGSSTGNINLNISGTIKLEANGRQVDLTSLINDTTFIRHLSGIVKNEFNRHEHHGKMMSDKNQRLGYNF